MDEQTKAPNRILWLTGPKTGQVEPPWPEERVITPALERLIEALAQKAAEDFLAEERARVSGDTLLRIRAVMSRVGLSRTTIYARIAAGAFPKPVSEGGVSRWFESEIDEYIAGLKARRDDRPSP